MGGWSNYTPLNILNWDDTATKAAPVLRRGSVRRFKAALLASSALYSCMVLA